MAREAACAGRVPSLSNGMICVLMCKRCEPSSPMHTLPISGHRVSAHILDETDIVLSFFSFCPQHPLLFSLCTFAGRLDRAGMD